MLDRWWYLLRIRGLGRKGLDVALFGRDRGRVACELGGTPTASDAGPFGRRCDGWRGSDWCHGSGSPTAARRRRRLLLGANPFLTLPARANASDLVVSEEREMAAYGDIHLTKEVDHLVTGDPELACHVVYTKLAQTVLLAGSRGVRSLPLVRGGLDERTNAPRELCIDDSNGSRRFPSNRGAKLGRRWSFDQSNAFRPQHGHNLVQAVPRCVRRYDGELELSPLRRVANLLHANNHEPPIHSDSE